MTYQGASSNVDERNNVSQSRINPNIVKRVHREVRFGSYILGSTLGEGEFGKVKLGWRKDGKQPSQVAIKLIKRDTIMKDSESEIKIHREINSLKMLNHPNIVNLVEVMKSGKYIGIVLEYASGGELFDYILHHKYLKENIAKKLFAQLVSGVDYMHSKGLIHRDLKLENLLLDKHKNVIISDFGFVNSYNKEKNDFMKTSCGSPCYAAPELVLTQSAYEGRKVDIWSLGVILYAMLSGYLPFDDDPENEDGSDIVKLYHYICKTPLTFPEYVSPLARDLLRKIIVPDPKKRITMNEIRNHPWLASYANLLSIRQPEWDKIHKDSFENKLINNTQNKRFSMINERTNSSSLMMSSNNRPYSSNNIGYLYSNPSTSSSLANAVALTKSPASTDSEIGNEKPKISPTRPQRGHLKASSISNTYPSASTALKAMVTENRSSVVSFESLKDPVFTPPTTKATYHFPSNLPRSTTYTGTPVTTIAETPSKVELDRMEGIVKESILPSAVLGSNNVSSRDSNRLPHATKKPRPTSYHPSSLTSSLMTGNNQNQNALLDYIKMPSPMNLAIPPFLSSPTKANAETTETSCSSPSKSIASTNSRRNSVVTHVHVNGVLSTEASNLNSHENKRNSVLSYLEDKMDKLELSESHASQKNNESIGNATITPQIDQIPLFDSHLASPSEGSEARPIEEKISSDIVPLTVQKVDSATIMESNSGNITGRSIESSDIFSEKESELEVKSAAELQHLKPSQKSTSKDKKEKLYTEPVERQDTRSSHRPGRDSNKENKENKKRNRFSLLSFYSSYNASMSNVSSIHLEPPSQAKKILEPSTEGNVSIPPTKIGKNQKRLDSSTSSKSSSSKKSSHSNSTVVSSVNGKEASAAKKVMDFFKRRSIRIG